LFEAKNILTGILHLEKAVKLYPQYSDALLLLSTAYMDGQQWQKAETTLKKLMEIDPKCQSRVQFGTENKRLTRQIVRSS
jgi:tetratricopeptide (TPR) repeat protein